MRHLNECRQINISKDSSKRQFKQSSEIKLSYFATAATGGRKRRRGEEGRAEKTGIIFHY